MHNFCHLVSQQLSAHIFIHAHAHNSLLRNLPPSFFASPTSTLVPLLSIYPITNRTLPSLHKGSSRLLSPHRVATLTCGDVTGRTRGQAKLLEDRASAREAHAWLAGKADQGQPQNDDSTVEQGGHRHFAFVETNAVASFALSTERAQLGFQPRGCGASRLQRPLAGRVGGGQDVASARCIQSL
jgi:hypothetical protein